MQSRLAGACGVIDEQHVADLIRAFSRTALPINELMNTATLSPGREAAKAAQ